MSEPESMETLERRYSEFFRDHEYQDRMRAGLESGKFRALVSINDLREAGYANDIINNPRMHMVALRQAAEEFIKGLDIKLNFDTFL